MNNRMDRAQMGRSGARGPRRGTTVAGLWVAVLAFMGPGLMVELAAQTRAPEARPAAPRTITWEDLIPKGWDPMAPFRERNVLTIREGSAAEREMMRELRDVWDKAPTRADLAGQALRLPGYVVPLDQMGDKLKEFLLVPYFGACIHSPPPPANQIVHVVLNKPVALRTMDVVWVVGKLSTERQDTAMGVSGYSLAAEEVEPYKAEKADKSDRSERK